MDHSELASLGGKARAKKLSKKRRAEIALMGAIARKRKLQKGDDFSR